MIEADRSSVDVITQLSAIEAALDKVSLTVLEGHARRVSKNGDAAGEQIDELMRAVGRLLGR